MEFREASTQRPCQACNGLEAQLELDFARKTQVRAYKGREQACEALTKAKTASCGALRTLALASTEERNAEVEERRALADATIATEKEELLHLREFGTEEIHIHKLEEEEAAYARTALSGKLELQRLRKACKEESMVCNAA